MKNLKIVFSVMVLFLFANISFAQSAKTQTKAEKKVEKINAAITSIDESLALTAEQREKIIVLQNQNFEDLKALKTSDASDEDKKAQKRAINKAFRTEINKNILTEEQTKAQKTAKAARKAGKGKGKGKGKKGKAKG